MPITTLAEDGLRIDSQRFTIIGAEIHNSSSSAPEYIWRSFKRVAQMGANTVLAPVAWDQFEPTEGRYDYTLIELMLTAAEECGLKLIPLWFGSWKNATSSYVPAWVKRDTVRFPRARTLSGGVIEHLSPFGQNNLKADKKAFGALMSHLHEVDAKGTVIMVQVENEVGILGDARDRSALAEAAWTADVPRPVISALDEMEGLPGYARWVAGGSRQIGPWQEVLGDTDEAHEIFMAWAYASYIEKVAAEGRSRHDVPLFVNAWLDSEIDADHLAFSTGPALAGGMKPGKYPSGGPVTRVGAIWRAVAPTLDILAPDIYFGDIHQLCTSFRKVSGHLLIPEMRRSAIGVGHMHVALGQYGAIGISPFGVDSVPPGSDEETILTDGYRLLSAASLAIQQASPGSSKGFLLRPNSKPWSGAFGHFTVSVQLRPGANVGYGILIEENPGTLIVVGRNVNVKFGAEDGQRAGILRATQLEYDGKLREVQLINGDETMSGTGIRMHDVIPPTAPSPAIPMNTQSTGIARVELYVFEV